ncbi:MAG: hypothetical protein U5L45_12800 [Saprospiraceae bacterium]|nr:hypothetical protein [Saprospiraceae bacterium]
MGHFSGKARKMTHLSSFCASKASAKAHLRRILVLCLVSNNMTIKNDPEKLIIEIMVKTSGY